MIDVKKAAEKLARKSKAVVGSCLNNKPYLKVMLVAKREGLKTFYFASNNSSLRVKQWTENDNACVYFYGGIPYKGLMLDGKMQILNDENSKQKIWNPMFKGAYKGGINDPDFCVLKFTATNARFYRMYKSEDFEI